MLSAVSAVCDISLIPYESDVARIFYILCDFGFFLESVSVGDNDFVRIIHHKIGFIIVEIHMLEDISEVFSIRSFVDIVFDGGKPSADVA